MKLMLNLWAISYMCILQISLQSIYFGRPNRPLLTSSIIKSSQARDQQEGPTFAKIDGGGIKELSLGPSLVQEGNEQEINEHGN